MGPPGLSGLNQIYGNRKDGREWPQDQQNEPVAKGLRSTANHAVGRTRRLLSPRIAQNVASTADAQASSAKKFRRSY